MTPKEIQKTCESTFESIRKTNQQGQDFWSARELQTILDYAKWDKFLAVIEKAKQSCLNSGHKTEDHFLHLGKMVDIGSGAQRKIEDIELSRYACYLIVQNADPAKPIVALGQTYFAVQTRKQELIEESDYQNLIGLFQIKDVGEVQYNDLFSLEKRPNIDFLDVFSEEKVNKSLRNEAWRRGRDLNPRTRSPKSVA